MHTKESLFNKFKPVIENLSQEAKSAMLHAATCEQLMQGNHEESPTPPMLYMILDLYLTISKLESENKKLYDAHEALMLLFTNEINEKEKDKDG